MISLPIDSKISEIVNAFSRTKNVILTAPPGTGKTIRVPAALAQQLMLTNLSALSKKNAVSKKIIVLVPKRIAALAAAQRTAEEQNWQLGEQVGFQVRFENKTSLNTKLIFMTEGVFVKKMQNSDFMNSIDTIIFDEFHERSALNDIALAYCYEYQLLTEKLNILIMSATLNTDILKNYLQNPIHIDLQVKTFPLTVIKHSQAQKIIFDQQLVQQLVEKTKEAWSKQKSDILIFLPGMSEIRFLENKLNTLLPNIKTERLHGSLKLEEQKRIISSRSERRIILSTNIAESSITLPNVDCVIDSGLEKKVSYENKIGFHRLELKRISHFSAQQRAGRAARTMAGICYQMWHDSDDLSMPAEIEPEILKSSLLEETLILLSVGISDPQNFSWLTKPKNQFQPLLIKYKTWGLINNNNTLTPIGKMIQSCPLDIEKSIIFIQLCEHGFHKQSAYFCAYWETNDFSNETTDDPFLNPQRLNDLGQKIERQLLDFYNSNKNSNTNSNTNSYEISYENDKLNILFKTQLLKIFIKNFPEKMGQRKLEQNVNSDLGISALGRGIQFAKSLIDNTHQYYILLKGRELQAHLTWIEFALGYSENLFLQLTEDQQKRDTEFTIDFDKKIIYKQDKKMIGLFVISKTNKIPLNQNESFPGFKNLFLQNYEDFLKHHPDWINYEIRINFLSYKKLILELQDSDFIYLNDLKLKILESLTDSIHSLEDFFNYPLFDLLNIYTPENILFYLKKLVNQFQLPNGKSIPIDYSSDNAPMISLRIQEALGIFKTPFIIENKIPLTFELLAPNYRPAQITSQLEKFWQISYFEVRKELRARYPKHDWPENPLEWKPEMSKRIKK